MLSETTRSALLSAIDKLDASDRKAVMEKLQAAQSRDSAVSADHRRVAKLEAAMADPEKHGSIEYVKGCLRRIGLNCPSRRHEKVERRSKSSIPLSASRSSGCSQR
jgi:hypothetical protein